MQLSGLFFSLYLFIGPSSSRYFATVAKPVSSRSSGVDRLLFLFSFITLSFFLSQCDIFVVRGEPMEALRGLDLAEKLGLVLGMVIVGLTTVASGQLLLVIREIALNTRKAELSEDGIDKRSNYPILEGVSVLNNILGWVVVALAFVLAVIP
jgi:hypothetical protein